jgi:hypothetical protein
MNFKELCKEILVAGIFFVIATPIALYTYQSQQAEKQRVEDARRKVGAAVERMEQIQNNYCGQNPKAC